MIRRAMAGRGVGLGEFRWRGQEITRFEGFSDAVLAFAVTLLVVSLEVPRTFTELMAGMRGFAAFAICFATLIHVWYLQYVFFRRYALQDRVTLLLNATLLFVVLFYVYPLKFLFRLMVDQFTGVPLVVVRGDGHAEPVIEAAQAPALMLIYGAGFVAVFLIFALLFQHAYRKRKELDLNAIEAFDTRFSVRHMLLSAAVGVLSMGLVLIGGPKFVALSGWVYFLLGPVLWLNGVLSGQRRRRLAAASGG